jgi:hypothetical protein
LDSRLNASKHNFVDDIVGRFPMVGDQDGEQIEDGYFAKIVPHALCILYE